MTWYQTLQISDGSLHEKENCGTIFFKKKKKTTNKQTKNTTTTKTTRYSDRKQERHTFFNKQTMNLSRAAGLS